MTTAGLACVTPVMVCVVVLSAGALSIASVLRTAVTLYLRMSVVVDVPPPIVTDRPVGAACSGVKSISLRVQLVFEIRTSSRGA